MPFEVEPVYLKLSYFKPTADAAAAPAAVAPATTDPVTLQQERSTGRHYSDSCCKYSAASVPQTTALPQNPSLYQRGMAN